MLFSTIFKILGKILKYYLFNSIHNTILSLSIWVYLALQISNTFIQNDKTTTFCVRLGYFIAVYAFLIFCTDTYIFAGRKTETRIIYAHQLPAIASNLFDKVSGSQVHLVSGNKLTKYLIRYDRYTGSYLVNQTSFDYYHCMTQEPPSFWYHEQSESFMSPEWRPSYSCSFVDAKKIYHSLSWADTI